MIGDVNLAQVIVAGILGALSMALASFLFNAIRVPVVDFGRLIATKLLRYHSHGTRLGLVLHLLNGVVLAFAYAFLVERLLQAALPGAYLVHGLIYGIGLWLFMMAVILPMLGDGFFGWRASKGMIPSGLFVHLLYGLILGFAFRQ